MANPGSVELCLETLREMHDTVIGSRKAFMSGNACVIDREYLLAQLEKIEKNMPEAVRKAMQVVQGAQALQDKTEQECAAKVRDAQSQAAQIVQDAQQKANAVTSGADRSGQEMLRKAQEEAHNTVEAGRMEAQRIVEDAQRRAAVMVNQEEIVRRARVEANEIRENVQQESAAVRQNTYDYLDNLLNDVDHTLTGMVNDLRMERNEINAHR